MSKYVRREDITLRERIEYGFPFDGVAGMPERTTWIAELDGRLSTGEHIVMEREADTLTEAYNLLMDAIHDQGWSVE